MKYAITGVAMRTSIGNTTSECFTEFCKKTNGNKPLVTFDQGKFNVKHAYEIDDRTAGADRVGRATGWLKQVIKDAIQSAELIPGDRRVAVLVGTGLRELRSLELWWADEQDFELKELHFGESIPANLKLRCPVYTLSNACAASNFALGLAYDMLELKEIDVAIVAGCDSITESMFGLLDRVNPLHPQKIEALDKNRKGVVMGEGAAAVVLEAEPQPTKVKAWLRGVGMSCDAYQDTKPFKNGLVASMQDAYRRAEIKPGDVDLLFVHGTGTILNDLVELQAVNEFFTGNPSGLKVTGLKSNIGHTSGAAALVNVVSAVECFQQNVVPPMIELREPIDEAAGFDLIREQSLKYSPDIIQINSFGFGGVNAVSILERK